MCETNEKLTGKVAIVTGGSSGIGFEAAKELAKKGANVIIASRNETKLKIARDNIEKETGNPNVAYKILDLGSLESVRQFVKGVESDKLDILVNNAGAVALPDKLTADDLNLTMQVNFFGTFFLTYLLLPKLKVSSPSRIINTAAVTMYLGEIDFDHWNDIGRYNLLTSLGNSKLAMAVLTAELDRRFKNDGIITNSFDPFVVRDTDVLGNVNGFLNSVSQFFVNMIGQKKEDVGKQVAYLAAAPELANVSGKLYKFCKEIRNHWLTKDQEFTNKFWEESKKAVKITPKESFD